MSQNESNSRLKPHHKHQTSCMGLLITMTTEHSSPPTPAIGTDSALLFWRNIALAVSQAPDCMADRLAGEHDRLVYRIRGTSPPGGFRAGESWFLRPALCIEEAEALVADLIHPHRRHGDLKSLPNIRLEILPTRVGEMLADDQSRKDLLERLQSFTPYDLHKLLADTPDGEWVWFFARQHWHLRLHQGRLIFPADWSVDRDFSRVGPMEGHHGHFPISNSKGLAGLADLDGRIVLPCRYRWLGHIGFRTSLLEAQSPDDRPDESDLIDLSGKRINPPGMKLLAGSFDTAGQAIVVREGNGEKGCKGLMSNDGRLLGEMRWRWINALNEDRAAVHDAVSGLWGYIDALGELVIPCRYREAHTFNDGRACFVPAQPPDEPTGVGLIDRQGNTVVAPCWKNLTHIRHDFIVEDFDGGYGVIDRNGAILLEPRQLTAAERGEGRDIDPWYDIRHTLQLALDGHARNQEAKKRIEADPQGRLSGLMHLFGKRTDRRDLINAGLWGMRVEITEDRPFNGWNFKAGDTGMIYWEYPVSGNIFDLAIEAPVMGLFGRDNQCLGVPWDLLCQTRTKNTEPS